MCLQSYSQVHLDINALLREVTAVVRGKLSSLSPAVSDMVVGLCFMAQFHKY